MKLDQNGMSDRKKWEALGYHLPEFDREDVRKATKEDPVWIHFGAGNIFRAFQANVVQQMLNRRELDKGLIVAEGYDYEIIEKMNHPHDDYTILVTLKADGTVEKTVVAEDFKSGAEKPQSYIGKVTSLLYARFLAGKKPIAMVSMDNCPHNGDKLYAAIHAFAEEWTKHELADQKFLAYVEDKNRVSFPWTMIDKITPRPDASVEDILKKDGIEDLDPVITSQNTYAAPFVNAEECEYLVIEDAFPNGRPQLEKSGLMFTDRETVDKVEKMKVCTCLNPLHTALAVFGCLLGYELISEEMKDETLRKLVEKIGYTEGLPVVVDPKIIDPKDFIDTVLNVRIPNPFMPDTPQRIATDTSQKLAIRFGETIKAYAASKELNVKDLTGIPLVFAGWLRYLTGIDDNGKKFELSPDPLYNTLYPYVKDFKLGEMPDTEQLRPVLSNAKIFGVNLYEAGMADVVCEYFKEMCMGTDAVRNTLEKYV